MRIEVYLEGTEPEEVFDSEPDVVFADYNRLSQVLGESRNSVAKVRNLLSTLETNSSGVEPGDGTAAIDQELPFVTVAARWARLREAGEFTVALKASTRLDLILSAIEQLFPDAEVKLS